MKKGSKEWFLELAEILGELLQGIELFDYRGKDVTPPVQVAFLVPRWYDMAPCEVIQVINFDGCRKGVFWVTIGERNFTRILFDFYHPEEPSPTRKVVKEVAERLGFSTKQESTNLVRYYKQ